MNPAAPQRRSRTVNLALLGAAGGLAATGLAGCSRTETFQRNVYPAATACAADYSAATCQTKGQPGAGRFLGPTYRAVNGRAAPCTPNDPGPGRQLTLVQRDSVIERGGFGLSCSRSSSSSNRSWGG